MTLLLISFIRTIVPGIVGAVLGFFTTMGLEVDPAFEGALTAVLGTMFLGLYYLIVRVIELKVPQVGVLLGYAKSPDSYSKGPGVDITKSNSDTVNVYLTEPTPGTTVPFDKPGPDHRAE